MSRGNVVEVQLALSIDTRHDTEFLSRISDCACALSACAVCQNADDDDDAADAYDRCLAVVHIVYKSVCAMSFGSPIRNMGFPRKAWMHSKTAVREAEAVCNVRRHAEQHRRRQIVGA